MSDLLKAAALVFAGILISGCWINANNMHVHVAAVMIVVIWWLDCQRYKDERKWQVGFYLPLLLLTLIEFLMH